MLPNRLHREVFCVTYYGCDFQCVWDAPLYHVLLLAGCNADTVAGALAAMLHHEVEAMFEIGDTIR